MLPVEIRLLHASTDLTNASYSFFSLSLDESLIKNSVQSSAQLIEQVSLDADIISATESPQTLSKPNSLEVKVEITPPSIILCTESLAGVSPQTQPLPFVQSSLPISEFSPKQVSTTTSLDSTTSANTLGFSHQDFPPRASVSAASPQQRKMSEFSQDSLLNPNGFNRMTPSPGANSSRLFKKIEEMMDLSSPYNHYRCLSPSESNLVQCGNNILNMGTTLQNLATLGGNLSVPLPAMTMANTFQSHGKESGVGGGGGGEKEDRLSVNRSSAGFTPTDGKPGSGRLLRRQFSLDKDDLNNNNKNLSANNSLTLSNNLANSACLQAVIVGNSKAHHRQPPPTTTISSGRGGGTSVANCAQEKHSSLPSISAQTLISKLQQSSESTSAGLANRHPPLYKNNSSSISQDLEKIEELPASPNHPFISSSGPHYQQQREREHGVGSGMYSESSLTNSIPFIDGSSCSSSISTIHSSATEKRMDQKRSEGGGDWLQKDDTSEQVVDLSAGKMGKELSEPVQSTADPSTDTKMNIDTLLLLR